MLIELKAAGADVAAARPGVHRILEEADGRTVLMESDVAADQIAAVCQAMGKATRLRQQQQPSGLYSTARENHDVGLLLNEVAVGIHVHGCSCPAALVDGYLTDIA